MSRKHQIALAAALRKGSPLPGAMNALPPTQEASERTSRQWLAFKDGLRSQGRKQSGSKGGKKSGENRAKWRDSARADATALLRDGLKRADIVATLAQRYERTKETLRDVLREVLPPSR